MLTPCTIYNFPPNATFGAEMVIDEGRHAWIARWPDALCDCQLYGGRLRDFECA